MAAKPMRAANISTDHASAPIYWRRLPEKIHGRLFQGQLIIKAVLMNKLKSHFYNISLLLSASCLVIMTLLILAQIAVRFSGKVIPSSEDFAGWLLSAMVFFGLAYTFNTSGHIRVTMMLSRLTGAKRTFFEFINLSVGLLISAFLGYYTSYTVYESYIFKEVSDTYLAVPLWQVQLPMAIGSVFLCVAIIDNFVMLLQGETPNYMAYETETTHGVSE